MTVLSAIERVIDGLAVEMAVKVGSKNHDISCDFEVSANHTDAKLKILFLFLILDFKILNNV